jgi:hypothetical protein
LVEGETEGQIQRKREEGGEERKREGAREELTYGGARCRICKGGRSWQEIDNREIQRGGGKERDGASSMHSHGDVENRGEEKCERVEE